MYKLQTIHKVWSFFCIMPAQKCKVLKFLPPPLQAWEAFPFRLYVLTKWLHWFQKNGLHGNLKEMYVSNSSVVLPLNTPHQSIEKWKLNMKQLPNPKRMKFLICQFCQVQIIKDWLQKHTFVMRVESTFMQSVILSTFNWLLILKQCVWRN